MWDDKTFEKTLTISWWNNNETPSTLTLDGLVTIIDKCSKNLKLALGLVDSGREIVDNENEPY
jgi:hypothetical protein